MRRTEDALSELRRIAAEIDDPAARESLRTFVAHSSCHVVARAAKLALQHQIEALAPDLAAAFPRFMNDSVKRDPGCVAKVAIVTALVHFDWRDPDVYVAGIRHVQMEGTYGPPEDRAAGLRGLCGAGLAQMRHRDAAIELVTLLNDRWLDARKGAAQALARTPVVESEALLRMKALAGDQAAEVVGECLAGLMAGWPSRSLSFVEGFLDSPDPNIAGEAAIAIGESRHAEAFALLRRRAGRGVFEETLALAMALTKDPAAMDYLIGVIAGGEPEALHAVRAMALYRADDAIRARVRQAIDSHSNRAMHQLFDAEFNR